MTAQPLRLAFAGTPDLAAHVLERLISDTNHTIVSVFTQPDRPAGRGRRNRPSPVKELATTHALPVKQPANREEFETVANLDDIDALIVVAYGLILPASKLQVPRFGCLNIHTSLLPRWRGAAPIQRAIEHGDSETGVSIMQMDAGLDTGPVILQKTCPIDPRDTAGTLHDKLAELGAEAIIEALRALVNGTATISPQSEAGACYAHKIKKEEGLIDWNRSAVELDCMIRAFNPAPVAYTRINGQDMRIWKANIGTRSIANAVPGTVLNCDRDGIEVACEDGSIVITELQIPGKRPMIADIFLNGHPDFHQH